MSPGRLLTISSRPLPARPPRFKLGKDLVVVVTRDEFHSQLESGGLQQAEQGRQSGLAPVALIGRDHRGRNAGARGQLRLAETTLDSGELKKSRSGRGMIIRLCHQYDCISR